MACIFNKELTGGVYLFIKSKSTVVQVLPFFYLFESAATSQVFGPKTTLVLTVFYIIIIDITRKG